MTTPPSSSFVPLPDLEAEDRSLVDEDSPRSTVTPLEHSPRVEHNPRVEHSPTIDSVRVAIRNTHHDHIQPILNDLLSLIESNGGQVTNRLTDQIALTVRLDNMRNELRRERERVDRLESALAAMHLPATPT